MTTSCNKRKGNPRILVFSKTAGFHHESIPQGIAAIQKLGAENGFRVDTTSDAGWFIEDSLKNYSAVIFLNTTGNLLNHYQEAEFERYIQAGGGFAGVHAASDAEYDWGWYGRLVGGYFESHPEQQEATLKVQDSGHESSAHLPGEWKRKDEWYNFKKLNKDVKVLLTIDEKTYKGGKNGDHHPMAWYHEYDGGRAFYTALGHTDESYSDPLFLKHLLGGIRYAIGGNKNLDYGDCRTEKVPEEDRFTKTVLNQGAFFEPTEMAILPNMNILVAQRRGELMMYDKDTRKVKQVGFLNVYYKTDAPGVNAEEGLLGLAADPDYRKNNYIYLFYSPADTSVNRLSRFVFRNDTLDLKSEKVILQFYSQRDICCHTGGSIAFGKDNEIFVSTGDNSTPFDQPNQAFANHGFAPLDDRKGFENYDARRSAGNTNDLRGKILRIKLREDGSYDIPEGNLFAPDEKKARPEIYVMGNRNPYRISVDKKTGYLYWGEVGPDAQNDSVGTRGPRGYDEVNQARKAGFFGWPLFVGKNYPYHSYNYETGESGPAFAPQAPVNNSRNNTGLQKLPPVAPAFIWYPYAESPDFPQLGGGGRTAMAGPVYYTADYMKNYRYPEYYNGKLFIYDWVRGWIKAVTLRENGDYDKMEPFMEHTRFNAPVDMEVGPDGVLYVLEYGSGWFSKNADAGLARLDFNGGNLAPKVTELKVKKESGALPFTINATVKASDPENDELTYLWTIGTTTRETMEPVLQYSIQKPGKYDVSVEVIDKNKGRANSNTVPVYAGNEQPQVDIILAGNRSFFFPGKQLSYQVKVTDKGDEINPANLFVSADYIQGTDLAGSSLGHQVVSETIMGKNIMLTLDCKTCHKVEEPSIGPSFKQVAQRYKDNAEANTYLPAKIIEGGSGVWGENAMPAHPTLDESDARKIVQWILSLGNAGPARKSLPASGTITVPANPVKPNTVYALTANYTDNGGAGVLPLSATKTLVLRESRIDVKGLKEVSNFATLDSAGHSYLVFPAAAGSFKIEKVDLKGISGISIAALARGSKISYRAEVFIGKPGATKIGEAALILGQKWQSQLFIPLGKTPGDGKLHDLTVVLRPMAATGELRPIFSAVNFKSK